jgi:hypothetical protein
MLGGRIRKAWVYAVLAVGLTAAGACATNAGSDEGYGTEVDGCRACQIILVECSSTAKNEAQFVECRDQWLGCQRGKGIGISQCRNPRDELACDLCRERLTKCKTSNEAATCEAQFGVCKAFLITRGDVADQCNEDGSVSPEVACSVCKKDYAKCVSDGSGQNTPSMCSSKFTECLATNELQTASCPVPSGSAACDLCKGVRDGCAATGATDCAADFTACSKALAPNITCETTTGTGGGTGGTATCSHSACEFGPALKDNCSACVTKVCDEDSYCCNETAGTWDTFCLNIAKTFTECSCQGTSTNQCAHSPCEYGDKLTNGCNACVSTICGQDAWCCNGKWDNYCVEAAENEPACDCTISI